MDNVGYYALIHYMPDVERQEFVNVGVAMLNKDTGEFGWKITNDLKRVKRFFDCRKDYDEERIRMTIENFGNRLDVEELFILENFKQFIDTRANQMQFGHLCGKRIRNFKEDLEDLYKRLVIGENDWRENK